MIAGLRVRSFSLKDIKHLKDSGSNSSVMRPRNLHLDSSQAVLQAKITLGSYRPLYIVFCWCISSTRKRLLKHYLELSNALPEVIPSSPDLPCNRTSQLVGLRLDLPEEPQENTAGRVPAQPIDQHLGGGVGAGASTGELTVPCSQGEEPLTSSLMPSWLSSCFLVLLCATFWVD